MFTGLPRLRHGADEVGLAAQEGRRLQHVDHLGRRGDSASVCTSVSTRHAELALHLGQDLQALLHARAAEAACPRSGWPCRSCS